MKQFAKIILFVLLLSPVYVTAQHVQTCIAVTGPGTLDNSSWPRAFIKCRWDTINLLGSNCITPVPGDYNASYVRYQWRKVGEATVISTSPNLTNIVQPAQYELTILYDYPTTGAQFDRDTVAVQSKTGAHNYAITAIAPDTDPNYNTTGQIYFATKCEFDTLSLTGATGANYSNHKWYETSAGRTFIKNGPTFDAKNTTAKQYLVTAWDNVTNCIVGEQVQIAIPPSPAINLGADKNICTGGNTTLQSTAPLGAGTFVHTWSTGANTTSINVSTAGTYSLTIQRIGTGCKNYDTIQVNVHPYPDFSFDDAEICYATASQVLAPEIVSLDLPATYSWAASADLSPLNTETTTASPGAAGPYSYSLTITSAHGCPTTKSINVTKHPQLNSSVDFTDSTICRNTDVTLLGNTATGGVPGSGPAYTYRWRRGTNNLGNSQNVTVSPDDDATFQYIVTDGVDCSVSIDVNITVAGPSVSLGADKFGDGVNPVLLNPTVTGTVTAYDWYTQGSGTSLGTDPTLSVTLTENYVVIVTDGNCDDSDTVRVTMIEGNITTIYVPNAFSPESTDDENKVVKVYGPAISSSDFSFKIYNRWGDLVYFTNNLVEAQSQGWSGPNSSTDKNQQNVYTYSVSGKFLNGEEFAKTGTITLVR